MHRWSETKRASKPSCSAARAHARIVARVDCGPMLRIAMPYFMTYPPSVLRRSLLCGAPGRPSPVNDERLKHAERYRCKRDSGDALGESEAARAEDLLQQRGRRDNNLQGKTPGHNRQQPQVRQQADLPYGLGRAARAEGADQLFEHENEEPEVTRVRQAHPASERVAERGKRHRR